MKYTVRTAFASDISRIKILIEKSVRGLSAYDYTQEQIEGALLSAWGLDTQLIKDETYFVVETENLLIGCRGWSYRATLFGNDRKKDRNPDILNPAINSAKIRAFFIKPRYARKGIGSMIMQQLARSCRNQILRTPLDDTKRPRLRSSLDTRTCP
ncbi:GNAT family N-acetyltransferase [uncultured Microbulbifer sp.]|uniref:GNAT family N-acetyltransferase n=1 Tax=uncultured Microbulbifer sp. TaxID=348147 RepID=UPI003450D407